MLYLLSFLICFFIGTSPTIQAAEPTIDRFDARLEMANDGTVKMTEDVHYRVREEQPSVKHAISLGSIGEMDQLELHMKDDQASEPFPFAQSSSKDIGTFTANRKDNRLEIEAFNPLVRGSYSVTYQSHLTHLWTNYADGQVFDLSLFHLPYDSKNLTIHFVFPQAIEKDALRLHLANREDVKVTWISDKEVQLELKNMEANQGLAVQMVVPRSVMRNNENRGPDSQGKQIIDSINEQVKSQERTVRRHRWTIQFIAWTLFLLTAVFSVYVIWLKQKMQQVTSRQTSVSLSQSQWSPLLLADFMKLRLNKREQFVITLFDLMAREKIAAQFIRQGKHIRNIHLRLLDTSNVVGSEAVLMQAFNRFAQKQKQVTFSLRDWQYDINQKGQVKASKAYVKVLRQLQQVKRKDLAAEKVYLRQNQLFHLVSLLLFMLSLGSVILFIYWMMKWQIQLILPFILLVLTFGLLVFVSRFILPIRNEKGVQYFNAYRQPLRALKSKKASVALANQANDADRIYLYSWLTGMNGTLFPVVSQNRQTTPLAKQTETIADLKLSEIKLSLSK